MTEAPPVVARGLVKRYGELVAVDHVDLTVEHGDVFGYLGPNGAGKTTSLRMMLGLIRPTAGHVRLFGRDPLLGVAARHPTVAIEVRDPREQELADVGELRLVDPETGRQLRVDTRDRKLRERFAAAAADERRSLVTLLGSLGIRHVALSTDGDWLRPLATFLRRSRSVR